MLILHSQLVESVSQGSEGELATSISEYEWTKLDAEQQRGFIYWALYDPSSGYSIKFTPQDFNVLQESNLIDPKDFLYCKKYGELTQIIVNPIDHNKIISFSGIVEDRHGNKQDIPLRSEDPKYGNPLYETEFRNFLNNHFPYDK